ncbi:adenylate/guanylate cyclase domain-containing protein [Mycolicibacterium goodii]|uniref:YHS domain-containing protein n=1 Tax=Mycolicibacterium goodii TaxID=134601 RepID=A0ABS6HJB9_MYCGD|nr:adenylate/guanylate cyclase domain-containing protein [Mycolicibacterium goodii]MBU8822781.1 YHS domain-containing protein [Mycolicibacterium goodii]MBU8838875.1 YHS domain-containing protein [Mycolicibacterium goodii]
MPSNNPDPQQYIRAQRNRSDPSTTDGWTVAALAAATGENPDDLLNYAQAGLLTRTPDGEFAPDAMRRTQLIQFARSHGISRHDLAAALTIQGDLLNRFNTAEPADTATHPITRLTRETALDTDVIDELMPIMGWDSIVTDADIAAAHRIASALRLGMPREALMQLLRVFSDTADRLADSVLRTFHDYVHEHHRAQGLSGPELLDASEHIAEPLLDMVEPTVVYFHRRALERAHREDFLRHLTESDTPPTTVPGQEHLTVLFIDLASFTPLTATMGDQVAAEVLRTFALAVRTHANHHRGRIIKQIGDEFMLMFTRPGDAISFGLAINDFVNTQPQFPALHIGAHTGIVLFREGDYLGATINLAARVASAGTAGQFLITRELHTAVTEGPNARFTPLPPKRLKGIPDPVHLVEVTHTAPARAHRRTDPVCGMLLHPGDVAATTDWHGTTFDFCSHLCRNAFTAQPERFVNAAGQSNHQST